MKLLSLGIGFSNFRGNFRGRAVRRNKETFLKKGLCSAEKAVDKVTDLMNFAVQHPRAAVGMAIGGLTIGGFACTPQEVVPSVNPDQVQKVETALGELTTAGQIVHIPGLPLKFNISELNVDILDITRSGEEVTIKAKAPGSTDVQLSQVLDGYNQLSRIFPEIIKPLLVTADNTFDTSLPDTLPPITLSIGADTTLTFDKITPVAGNTVAPTSVRSNADGLKAVPMGGTDGTQYDIRADSDLEPGTYYLTITYNSPETIVTIIEGDIEVGTTTYQGGQELVRTQPVQVELSAEQAALQQAKARVGEWWGLIGGEGTFGTDVRDLSIYLRYHPEVDLKLPAGVTIVPLGEVPTQDSPAFLYNGESLLETDQFSNLIYFFDDIYEGNFVPGSTTRDPIDQHLGVPSFDPVVANGVQGFVEWYFATYTDRLISGEMSYYETLIDIEKLRILQSGN